MADEPGKSRVYTVSLDFTNLKDQEAAFAKTISEISSKQRELDATTEDGRKQYGELGKQLKVVEGQMKLNQKAVNNLTKEEKANTDQTNFNNNSIKQNRELLKELTAEYIRIQKPTADQTKNLKTLSDTLKNQEKAIGDTRRSVGDYEGAIRNVISDIPGLNKGLEGVSNGFRAIGSANPFGLILQLLAPLIASFVKLEPVTNTINGIFQGITATITTIVSSVQNFFSLLSSGTGFLSAFSDSFSGLGDRIGNAATEGYNLVQAIDELEDAERANQAAIAQTNRDTAVLLVQSKDRNKTEQERISLLQQANKLEEEQIKKDLAIAFQRESLAAKQLATIIRNGGDRDKAEQDLADAQSKRFEAEQAFSVQTEKNLNRINSLVQTEADLRTKAAEKREKQQEKEKADEEKRLSELKKRAEEARKIFDDTTKAEFEFTKNATDIFYEQQQADLEENLANQFITEEEFKEQSLLLQQEKLQAQLIALQDYNTTVGGLDDEIARKEIELQNFTTKNKLDNIVKEEKAKEEQKKKDDKRIQDLTVKNQQFANVISDVFVRSLNSQEGFLKSFLKGVGAAILDALEKELIAVQLATIAKTTAQSLASPDSILSFGATGILRAGIIIGLIKAAFATFRSQVTGFANGGLIEAYAAGGLTGTRIMGHHGIPIRRSNGDNRLATVKTGEVILNGMQQQRLGGAKTFRRIGVPGFADGGRIAARNVDQNLSIDTNALVKAISAIQIVADVQEVTDKQNRIKFIDSIADV